MKIQQWLSENNLRDAHFAAKAGFSKVQAHRIIKKGKKPSEEEMQAIFAATNGAVTANDFYDLPDQGNVSAPPSGLGTA